MDEENAEWGYKGATLSEKNACKEFRLTQAELVTIKRKLKLLRTEIAALEARERELEAGDVDPTPRPSPRPSPRRKIWVRS